MAAAATVRRSGSPAARPAAEEGTAAAAADRSSSSAAVPWSLVAWSLVAWSPVRWFPGRWTPGPSSSSTSSVAGSAGCAKSTPVTSTAASVASTATAGSSAGPTTVIASRRHHRDDILGRRDVIEQVAPVGAQSLWWRIRRRAGVRQFEHGAGRPEPSAPPSDIGDGAGDVRRCAANHSCITGTAPSIGDLAERQRHDWNRGTEPRAGAVAAGAVPDQRRRRRVPRRHVGSNGPTTRRGTGRPRAVVERPLEPELGSRERLTVRPDRRDRDLVEVDVAERESPSWRRRGGELERRRRRIGRAAGRRRCRQILADLPSTRRRRRTVCRR